MNKIRLQAAWFGNPKTARDIRRTLGQVLFPLQPYVKRFDVFLKDFDDYLNDLVYDREYDWEVTEIGGFDEYNLGGTQIDVDDFEPDIMIETPSELTLKATTSVEIRKFVMGIANLLSSDIPNKRDFVSSFLNIFNNGKAANLIGKMIADRIQWYMKHEISELDEDNWGDVVSDAFMSEISGASLSRNAIVNLDKGRPKSNKSRASGRGIDIAVEVSYAASVDGSDLELDEYDDYGDYDRDYDRDYADWDARFASELERTWFGGTTKEAGMWQKIKRGLIRAFGKDVQAYEREFKSMFKLKILNRDQSESRPHHNFRGEGTSIDTTWQAVAPNGLYFEIDWKDLLGENMYNERTGRGWTKEDREEYKRNNGFLTWKVSVYESEKDLRQGRSFDGSGWTSKRKDAYRYLSKMVRSGKTARRVRNPRNLFRDEPKIKQMQKIWNQMMGMVRSREFEEELYEYGIESYLSDQISCDHLYDADDTGWSILNPDIEMEDIIWQPRDEWFDIFRKHNRKFDHMARQILELAEDPDHLEGELSEALYAVLLDAYKRGWDGDEFNEEYNEHREGC